MMISSPYADPRVAAVIAFFEHLEAADVAALGRLYTEKAFFKDPFNEVHDLAGVQRVFGHMFESLDAPVVRLAPPNVPVPFSPTLEDAYLLLLGDRALAAVGAP